MFELPQLLSYPIIRPIDDPAVNHLIVGKFCYIIDDYMPGMTAVIKRRNGSAGVAIGDWDGKLVAKSDAASWSKALEFLMNTNPQLISVLSAINLQQVQLFMSSDGLLVDIQLTANRLAGPGIIRDVFSKVIETQKIVEIATITVDKIDELKKSGKQYIIKPSAFKVYGAEQLPLYARI